jgi:6-phosphogluconolactonase (cycloisomerase 2 family)
MFRKLTTLAVAATAGITTAGIVGGLPVTAAATSHPPRVVGHVYQASNDAAGNAVHVYNRNADGTLEAAGSVATGGLGAGASLGSQGGLARDGKVVFVVNAGDDTVSALASTKHGLVLRDQVTSSGDFPVSVTVRNGVGYVLNQGDDTIAGFRYDRSGHLRTLPGSTRSLTPNPAGGTTNAAQVSFTPNGQRLVVTEKASNTIDTFKVIRGYAGKAAPHAAAGATPYGFDFDRRGNAIVSEATSGSASSYRVQPFTTITGALANTQAAACWLVVSGNVAYVVNAASASISTYAVAGDGSLTLLNAVAATTEAGPTDAAVSPDGRHLFVRVRSGAVSAWRIGPGGSLTTVGTSTPASAFGIAGLVTD